MTVTAIILSHYKEREGNLKRIIDDLMAGTVKPEKIIVFIDNPDIVFEDDRVVIIRSTHNFLPVIRFALGSVCETDACFFIDDDLTVSKETLRNFVLSSYVFPDSVLGYEGSIMADTETPYVDDTPIRGAVKPKVVDIIIRMYFVPTKCIAAGLLLRAKHPEFPRTSLDDVFLCLGNKYLNSFVNYVIPFIEDSKLVELPEGGVGQSYNGDHYKNRNEVCRKLMDTYE